jgi:hypothetical protein
MHIMPLRLSAEISAMFSIPDRICGKRWYLALALEASLSQKRYSYMRSLKPGQARMLKFTVYIRLIAVICMNIQFRTFNWKIFNIEFFAE